MRHACNLNPEWGYIAPAPKFLQTARVFVVAVAIGAVASAAVVFSLMDRPNAEASVAERTLVRSVEPKLPVRNAPPLVARPQTQSAQPLSQTGRDAAGAGAAVGAAMSTQGLPSDAALAEAPRIMTTEAPAGGGLASESNIVAASEAAPAAAGAPDPKPAPRKPRAVVRRYNVPRYAQRYEPRYESMERGSSYVSLRRYGSYGQEY
jgi:hypothetical protein